MTEPKRKGRPPGESNLKRRVAGKLYGTREFKNLMMETIAKIPKGEPTVAGIIKLWGDPDWDTPPAKLDLRSCIDRYTRQGTLVPMERGVYEVSEIPRLTPSHDFQLLAERAIRANGGFMKAKDLRRALGYSSEDARNTTLWKSLRMEGSKVRRDCFKLYLYNLPEDDLRNLVLQGRWALPYFRGVYLGMAPMPADPSARPWRALLDQHLYSVGAALAQAREANGVDIEEVLSFPEIVAALDVARLRNPARLSNRDLARQVEEMPDNVIIVGQRETRTGRLVDIKVTTPRDESDPKHLLIRDVRLDQLVRLENPPADPLSEFLDYHDYASLGADFFEAWAKAFNVDPIALSWGRLGLRPDSGWHVGAGDGDESGWADDAQDED
ncbi:hypothetical protein HOU02_gp205 [Caulobacter phage CcrBL9]|uniref:Uncharacterized protein n=1 Tax=Caulobacter phage CcrBL9 TaxID=2283270 RepID=A0A385ECY8_9CAUD|nr:hypothetical protein HOU02_gp205 [Caulobacter phage CcrBL9]AXQ69520.1 hypothetical protein CcrBL9_gp496 [Caulobacter phage CcrBL9]